MLPINKRLCADRLGLRLSCLFNVLAIGGYAH